MIELNSDYFWYIGVIICLLFLGCMLCFLANVFQLIVLFSWPFRKCCSMFSNMTPEVSKDGCCYTLCCDHETIV